MSPLLLVVLISRIAVDAFRLFGSEFGVKSSAWTIWLNVDGDVAIGSVHGTGKAGIGIAGLSFRPVLMFLLSCAAYRLHCDLCALVMACDFFLLYKFDLRLDLQTQLLTR